MYKKKKIQCQASALLAMHLKSLDEKKYINPSFKLWGEGAVRPPPCPLLKISLGNPYLKMPNLSKHDKDALMKKK